MYEKGDKLIHIRHGTDHSWKDVYYITEVWPETVGLARNHIYGERCVVNRQLLDDDLISDYPQFKIVPERKPIKLDEDLFTL